MTSGQFTHCPYLRT